ncbi:MAG: FAD-binding oxidoreductase, partial [Pseudomonadota bacterium]
MNEQLVSQFVDIVGLGNALVETDDLTHYTHENRGLFIGKTPLVLKPVSAAEVSEVVKLAAETKTQIVPQGGHTGHVGGAVPDESGSQIIVSLERMNRVREVDLDGNVSDCEAGCILEIIQKLADENDRLFPLALGSQGSCQIGGNISTNAGGTGVLAYGNTRQLVLGLEVVLPSGEIWNGLRRLKKDNTGYDLKDLFIGAEGTLGIVTAAVLKLFPKPKGKAVAFCGLETPSQALKLFKRANEAAGSALTAFELMARNPVEFTFRHMPGVRNPLSDIYPWHALVEVSSTRSEEDATS